MTYTIKKYKSFQEYLDAEELSSERNYRLLSTGEAIEVASENDDNIWIATLLIAALQRVKGIEIIELIRIGNKDIQVQPVGDKWVNRKPDVMLMRPEHRQIAKQAILFDMPAPAFVAEVVSPGDENSDNYKRDYSWKRQQYEWWQIPEYWIIDPHREKVTVLTLVDGAYQEKAYSGEEIIVSTLFPELQLRADTFVPD